MDACRQPLARAGARQAQERKAGRLQQQLLTLDPGHDASELRVSALAEENALGIDQHPMPIPLESRRADAHT